MGDFSRVTRHPPSLPGYRWGVPSGSGSIAFHRPGAAWSRGPPVGFRVGRRFAGCAGVARSIGNPSGRSCLTADAGRLWVITDQAEGARVVRAHDRDARLTGSVENCGRLLASGWRALQDDGDLRMARS